MEVQVVENEVSNGEVCAAPAFARGKRRGWRPVTAYSEARVGRQLKNWEKFAAC